MDFGKLITAMVTPFDQYTTINWSEIPRIVNYLVEEQKAQALVVAGTTGESATLSDEEKAQMFTSVVQAANGRCKVIAGTGTNDTAHCISLTKTAQKCGVDGILLVVPYYNKPSQEGMYKHFVAIANATDLPIMLYNIPSRTGASLNIATIVKLSQISNIVAIKECASFDQMNQVLNGVENRMHVYCGDDCFLLPSMSIGAHGIVSVASHMIGNRMYDMIQAYSQGDVTTARLIHQQLFPIFKGLFECPDPIPNPVGVKYALTLRGFPIETVRLPLVEMGIEQKQFVQRLFKRQ